jgi:hypothetical protein
MAFLKEPHNMETANATRRWFEERVKDQERMITWSTIPDKGKKAEEGIVGFAYLVLDDADVEEAGKLEALVGITKSRKVVDFLVVGGRSRESMERRLRRVEGKGLESLKSLKSRAGGLRKRAELEWVKQENADNDLAEDSRYK